MENIIKCECCGSLLDLDNTDWCDKCNRSIFDDSPCVVIDKDGNKGISHWKTMDYMYNWIKEKSGK